MKLGVALAFLIGTLSTVHGLRCYTCTATESDSCTGTTSCPFFFNRCFTLTIFEFDAIHTVIRGCQSSIACVGDIACCKGDLCNHQYHSSPR